MSREIEEARRLLEQRLQETRNNTLYGTVESVNEELRTCDVRVGGIVYDEVLLYAVEDQKRKGIVLIPSKDSVVLVSRIAGSNRLHVAMFSEIDKVLMTIGDKVEAAVDGAQLAYKNDKVSLKITGDKVELNADKVVFNGGDNEGMVRINSLTDKINALVDAFNNHTHTLTTGTVAVTGSPSSQSNPAPIMVPAITSKAQKLNKGDYENDKIQH